ncbi:Putative rRNA methylase [Amphibacillus marinus]|uniref:Putative rRNA methylase n=1 Tax=Amphibacillus marinus TaxID=872970 RepID=A0A1H8S1N1_9BACI|nr:class I SAM-dependent methyltransferase [Amphibacillus marinus]SEO72591.1 Putative rRNA methylase [Amphibacillus marinus]
MLKRVIPFAHELIQKATKPGEIVVDATCGNGHDTIVLCKATGPNGKVYAFDVQKAAIENTQALLDANNITHAELIHDSHHHVDRYLKEEQDLLAGAIFNLGYLPGSNKSVITKPEYTLEAINKMLALLKVGGVIVCVVYYGHPGGQEEKDALINKLGQLNQKKYQVLQYGFINQRNHPPFIIAIEKKNDKLL